MKSMNFIKKAPFVLFILLLFISGCGYKPSNYYAKKEFGGTMFIDLNVNLENPRNSVIIKDSMILTLTQKIGSKLVYTPKSADTIMKLRISRASMQELQYDRKGYNKLYRAVVVVSVAIKNEKSGKFRNFGVDGTYDFSVDDGAQITDAKRFEAIKIAAQDAMDEVISKLAVASMN